MQAHGARITLVAVSGFAIAAAVAGCGADATGAAHGHHGYAALGAGSTAPTASPDASAVPTATPVATSAPTSAPKPVVKAPAPVHHVTAPKPPPKPAPKPPVKPAPPVVTYKDGSYSSLGSYISPGGNETLRVTLTLSNDIITSLDVTSVMVDPTAAGYEADFEGGVNAVVVGRNIASIHVGAIGGSSLTSQGFNSALANIKAQAKN